MIIICIIYIVYQSSLQIEIAVDNNNIKKDNQKIQTIKTQVGQYCDKINKQNPFNNIVPTDDDIPQEIDGLTLSDDEILNILRVDILDYQQMSINIKDIWNNYQLQYRQPIGSILYFIYPLENGNVNQFNYGCYVLQFVDYSKQVIRGTSDQSLVDTEDNPKTSNVQIKNYDHSHELIYEGKQNGYMSPQNNGVYYAGQNQKYEVYGNQPIKYISSKIYHGSDQYTNENPYLLKIRTEDQYIRFFMYRIIGYVDNYNELAQQDLFTFYVQ